ncbi:hypothetical protein H4R33_000571 [Dimargaris cristalligena]|uniref:Lipid droplet-associated perilipin protein n=1 Tax=Dimargaris cristalligena TaxID=215637 RepID=A0A4P9ZZ01_9FUNG|nr:hypothetical protein H4R33_000571 [Dimargaris cristalligena]RKP38020.1 hypothetical protein BJ085DRAFT_40294 [Dimargaris cristalligena]|eukprot:RKP38020.1 hypothetical protein BJ085DRAFT_40294 [Dimargaris cristalligena]
MSSTHSDSETPAAVPDVTPASSSPQPTDPATTSSDTISPSNFVTRLFHLPLVHDTVTHVYATATDPTARYARLTNPLVGYTATLLHRAQDLSEPYVERLQGPLGTLDSFGCQSLDLLESRFPILTKPTDEVLECGKQTYQVYYDSVSRNVTRPFTCASAQAQDRMAQVVSKVDTALDTWLPEKNGEETPAETIPTTDALAIGRKVRRRLSTRLTAQPPLELVSSVLQASQQNLEQFNARLQDYVSKTRTTTTDYLASHNNLHSLSERALAEVERVSTILSSQVERLPQPVQGPVRTAIDHAADRYALIKAEVAKPDVPVVERAGNLLKITTAGVPVVDQVVTVLLKYTSNPTSPASSPPPGSPARQPVQTETPIEAL